MVAVFDLVDAVLLIEADNGRNGARLCNDDRMCCRRTGAQDDARDVFRRHPCDDGRLDLPAAENDLFLTDLRLFDAEDVLCNTLAHITKVDGARGKVFVRHLLEHLRLFLCSL